MLDLQWQASQWRCCWFLGREKCWFPAGCEWPKRSCTVGRGWGARGKAAPQKWTKWEVKCKDKPWEKLTRKERKEEKEVSETLQPLAEKNAEFLQFELCSPRSGRALKSFVGFRPSRRSTHKAPVQVSMILCLRCAPFPAHLGAPLILVRNAWVTRHTENILFVEKINQNKTERQSSSLLYEGRMKRFEVFHWEKKRWLGMEKWDVIVLYGIKKDREKVSKG